jgi:hypothetical protein
MVIVATFIAKLLDPIGAVIALLLGALISSRGVLFWGAFVPAIIVEMLLSATQVTRSFSMGTFVVGVLAMAVWVAIGHFGVRKLLRRG